MPVCKDTCLVKEASKTASQDKPPVEPTTPCERLRELAREKRMRREFMARIEPGSPVFGMLHRHVVGHGALGDHQDPRGRGLADPADHP